METKRSPSSTLLSESAPRAAASVHLLRTHPAAEEETRGLGKLWRRGTRRTPAARGGEGLQRRDGGGLWRRRPPSPARIRWKQYVAGGGRRVIGGAVAETVCEGVATFVVESHLLGDVQAVND